MKNRDGLLHGAGGPDRGNLPADAATAGKQLNGKVYRVDTYSGDTRRETAAADMNDRENDMDVLETRSDGSLLCLLSPAEAAKLKGGCMPQRKWWVKGITCLKGRPDAQHAFGYVVYAGTLEEAEREGARRAVAERGANGLLQEVGARDVTGKTRGIFGWR